MVGWRRLAVLVFIPALCFGLVHVVVKAEEDVEEAGCEDVVTAWSLAEIRSMVSSSALPLTNPIQHLQLHELLFYLHVPRTGGRTFHQCFLKHLFGEDEQCPRSYDKLRFDRSHPGCRLISTHDDYSILNKLSNEATSVVTSIRDPVDRVLSSYEFSIEVAARFLKKIAKKAGPAVGSKNAAMGTLNIWPWKYLVPTMQEDLFARRRVRLGFKSDVVIPGLSNETKDSKLSSNDSYDAPALAMPLREFIHHPISHELVHNGATFQIAGLTNSSYTEQAREIRTCISKFPELGQHVVKVAKSRLESMLHVGLTDNQRASAQFFTAILSRQISMEQFFRRMMTQYGQQTRWSSPHQVNNILQVMQNITTFDKLEREDVIDEVLRSYEDCVANLRNSQVTRRNLSLSTIPPIRFSKEMRSFIPTDLIDEVTKLNSLDVELFSHAKAIFAKQQKFLEQEDFLISKGSVGENRSRNLSKEDLSRNLSNGKDSVSKTGVGLFHTALAVLTVVFVAILSFLTKRKGSRVKET